MKSTKIFFVLFFALSFIMNAQQKTDYSKEAGYFNFNEIANFKNAEPTTEVYLEEPMLKMIGKIADNKKEGIGNMIGGLKLVCVNEYELNQQEVGAVENTLEAIDKTLLAKQWDRIIRSKHKNSFDNVYVRRDQSGEFAGLVVTSMHKFTNDNAEKQGKITLVNIVGKIDLNALGALSKELNIPGLGQTKEKEK
jgi:hypothetical protein